jgi:hypothetical protein
MLGLFQGLLTVHHQTERWWRVRSSDLDRDRDHIFAVRRFRYAMPCFHSTLSFRRALDRNDPQGRFTMTRCKGGSTRLDLIPSWGDGGIHGVGESDSSDY